MKCERQDDPVTPRIPRSAHVRRLSHHRGTTWATTEGTRLSMLANHPHDTMPELALRSALHRQGLRFFKHRRPCRELRCEADVVFPRIRLAVFLDGCFWHGCPRHGSIPYANRAFWVAKISTTQRRDARNAKMLRSRGWYVLRLWEHVAVDKMVRRTLDICAQLTSRTSHDSRSHAPRL
jgi:DNA mismatch endonuclease (patch repair protein)